MTDSLPFGDIVLPDRDSDSDLSSGDYTSDEEGDGENDEFFEVQEFSTPLAATRATPPTSEKHDSLSPPPAITMEPATPTISQPPPDVTFVRNLDTGEMMPIEVVELTTDYTLFSSTPTFGISSHTPRSRSPPKNRDRGRSASRSPPSPSSPAGVPQTEPFSRRRPSSHHLRSESEKTGLSSAAPPTRHQRGSPNASPDQRRLRRNTRRRTVSFNTLILSQANTPASTSASLRARSRSKTSRVYPEHYVRVRKPKRRERKGLAECFETHIVRIQRLQAHAGAIWCLSFSPSGKFLASGSQDGTVAVFETCFHQEEAACVLFDDDAFVVGKAHRRYLSTSSSRGAGGDVVTLAWSNRNFLAVATVDQTVRIFHVSRDDVLAVYAHPDDVTALDWHPTDPTRFVSVSFDERIRLWSLRQRAPLAVVDSETLLTSVAFSPDALGICVGTFDGRCIEFVTEENDAADEGGTLRLRQGRVVEVRSRRGKNRKKKVTGIAFRPLREDDEDEVREVLISTNDSRVRLYRTDDFVESNKFRGHVNKTSHIPTTFSHDGRFAIAGSETGAVHVWDTRGRRLPASESFSDSSTPVVNALFAPFFVNGDERVVVTGNFQGEVMMYRSKMDADRDVHRGGGIELFPDDGYYVE